MPLSDVQKQTLFSLLEKSGWNWRDDSIYAPNETMWLDRESPWSGDLADFYDRMCGRRDRIANNAGRDIDPTADTASLIAALETMRNT